MRTFLIGFLYLLKKSAKILRCLCLSDNDDAGSEEISRFVCVFEMWEDLIFGDAQYELNKRRQVKLRKPEELPHEDDIMALKNEVSRIMTIKKEDSEFSFIKLRDAVCTRLTLVNGRRGGEPAKMEISIWEEAKNDKWIDQQRVGQLDYLDQCLIKELKVTYMTGKGLNILQYTSEKSFCKFYEM